MDGGKNLPLPGMMLFRVSGQLDFPFPRLYMGRDLLSRLAS